MTRQHVLAALIVLSVITSLLGQTAAQAMRNMIQSILAPLGDAGMYITATMKNNFAASGKGGLTPQGAEALEAENKYLLGVSAYWKREAERNEQNLKEVLKFQDAYGPLKDLPCGLVPARVVGEGGLPYDMTRRLNVGTAGKVEAGSVVLLTDRSKALPDGLAVVTSSAMVGKIVAAGAFTAQMQLVTDPQFKSAARIYRLLDPNKPRAVRNTTEGTASVQTLTERNNPPVNCWAEGCGDGLVIKDVWRYESVQAGDLVVTNDRDYLPVEVRIGRVSEVKSDPMHPDRDIIKVKPDAELAALRDVMVVLPIRPIGEGKGKARR